MSQQQLYLQIAERFLTERGRLTVPLRLPDEHQLAAEHNVGRDTIRRAMRVLERTGAVTRRRKLGTFLQPPRSIVQGLTGRTIGLVPPWWADSPSAWFTSRVFDGVSRWADENKCSINVLHAERRPSDIHGWIEDVRDRELAGLIWVQPKEQQMPLVEGTAKLFPSVVLGRCFPGRGLHHVMPDYEQAARLIDQHLVDQGHHQYALVGKDALESFTQTWIDALDSAHRRRGSHFDAQWYFVDLKSFPTSRFGELLLDFYLPAAPDIRGFVMPTSSYVMGMLAYDAFRERIGRDISVVTIDYGQYPMEAYWPGHHIAHVTCDWGAMARRAVDVLSMLAAGQHAPEVIREPVGFDPGETIHPFDTSPNRDKE